MAMDSEMGVVGFGDQDDPGKDSSKSKRSNVKKSGGFQSMGLSPAVINGIQKRGYKIPTPIQRKSIPLILEGRDVVAMARTGSGKTACFLVPLLEKLKSRSLKLGTRAIILSPTRELAVQTLRFFKDLARYTDLQASAILGGDSMDNQFAAIHGSPDVIIATPGRFLHVCVEMELKLTSVDYIVFDEADRLFEMGFGDQLHEVVNRLPESRQTVLFSATLPKILVEFAKAGLNNPVLLRLDVESKIPDELKLAFISCRTDEKLAVLLCLLRNFRDGSPTVVFAATSHHVEYIHKVLDRAGISNTYIYSNLDPSARKINAAKFQTGKVSVLVVTDIAARGIDIPHLDNVINYNFPATSKLFVHRVGRCARAGRTGTAYTLVMTEERPYLLDLHLFLGRTVTFNASSSTDGVFGRVPQNLVEENHAEIVNWHFNNTDLNGMKKVSENAYKKYTRSRPGASIESVKRVKTMDFSKINVHPSFIAVARNSGVDLDGAEKADLLTKMKTYRPRDTIFEIGRVKPMKSELYNIMKNTRESHVASIETFKKKIALRALDSAVTETCKPEKRVQLAASSQDEINEVFEIENGPRRKKQKLEKDSEHYVPYSAVDFHTEQGFAVGNFNREADNLQIDMTGDNEETLTMQKRLLRWDRKKKKMVGVADPKFGKIRTESGVWIPATYKSNFYAEWKERTKIADDDIADRDDDADDDGAQQQIQMRRKSVAKQAGQGNKPVKLSKKKRISEIKPLAQILKKREKRMAEKIRVKLKHDKKGKGKGRKGKR